MSQPRVFISYSHDSGDHAARVRGLGASLARDGCDCRIDVYKDTDEDWPTWMTRELTEADFVLCVITETYERRFCDKELPDQGLGVGWEAGLIRRLLYGKKLHNERIFPVVFARADCGHIPLELEGYDYFLLDGEAGYAALLRKVLKQPAHARPATGTAPNLGSSTAEPLFGRPGEGANPPRAQAVKVEASKVERVGIDFEAGAGEATPQADRSRSQSTTGRGRPDSAAQSASGDAGRKPRVYLSYTWRTKGMKARALKLAERLLRAGIDVRIDFFYAKSQHGFSPPDPLPNRDSWDAWQEEQVRDSEFVLVICTPEYLASNPNTGAWRDMDYMQTELQSGRAEGRKFIPVGFGSYQNVGPLIPAFMQGATYYDLTAKTLGGFGFDDLVRRLKAAPAQAGVPQQQAGVAARASAGASGNESALAVWERKMEFLQAAEARTADAAQRFAIQEQIEEARTKIRELGG